MRSLSLILAASLTMLLAGGCVSFDAPAAEVTGVVVTEISDEAMTLAFDLELANPNDEPLQLHELRYTLTVDGRPVYQGRRSAQATLAAGATRTITVPAVARLDESPAIAQSSFPFVLEGQLGYLTPDRLSRVLRDLYIRRPKVRFSADGVVEPPSQP